MVIVNLLAQLIHHFSLDLDLQRINVWARPTDNDVYIFRFAVLYVRIPRIFLSIMSKNIRDRRRQIGL